MVLAKSKNSVGLGNSLMNDRFGKNKGADMRRGTHNAEAIQRTDMDGQTYLTNGKKEASWVKMRSVTEQGALDEFLSTADLAGTDFTAEKMNNVKIIHRDQKNPYLLSSAEERTLSKKHKENKSRLTVPRRPKWDEKTTPQELDRLEKASILDWRRGLAELQETSDLLMTPFERNLEVWRQLWRVIERSDLVVQIVDARNPLLFRSEDLEKYVKEVDPRKNNLLLVNKADMMTIEQRKAWADYFVEAGINFRYFSAELAKEINESRVLDEDDEDEDEEEEEQDNLAKEAKKIDLQDAQEEDGKWVDEESVSSDDEPLSEEEERTRILTTEELEELFLEHAPEIDTGPGQPPRKTQIGLVGYPNVGKSSTINALIGAKKVSVSATPGKTKHFQTIHLSDAVILCDCPGLVFPNFSTTKAELVCSGVLPVDQLREFTGPAGLVAQRIPHSFLEAVYGMKINIRPAEEGGSGVPTAQEVLGAYATARGFHTTGASNPDESRAARYILKDYVKGKLLFCHPPPREPPIDLKHFNRELYDQSHLPEKRRTHLAVASAASVTGSEDPSLMDDVDLPVRPIEGKKTSYMDNKFFGPNGSNAGHLQMPFQHVYSEQGQAKQLTGRKQKAMLALEKGVDPAELRLSGKKHFKANKRRGKGKARDDYD
ncbi:P-loop containing nucleoside triphosphate hydrolase protein [Mytilinidion resinicola]|uniref:P-loop containing nucleoside triphosphate hydrolase protein n=1 Tax=Mytilinidion resinicola TaxID=574789 RepID=A0A6A6YT01_9PEZI|nr:P-loop containing nucleoside triphosphate hydrolase protein [Mytilinidion resinicola]KAF2811493.1 P-loop containing nucleoside triphosphate hydrolase protein [Mytilinidion resinicola]